MSATCVSCGNGWVPHAGCVCGNCIPRNGEVYVSLDERGNGHIRTEPEIRAQVRQAVAAYRLQQDAARLARESEAAGRFKGRIEGVVWSLVGVLGALAALWLGGVR